jgi:hypothetical protein
MSNVKAERTNLADDEWDLGGGGIYAKNRYACLDTSTGQYSTQTVIERCSPVSPSRWRPQQSCAQARRAPFSSAAGPPRVGPSRAASPPSRCYEWAVDSAPRWAAQVQACVPVWSGCGRAQGGGGGRRARMHIGSACSRRAAGMAGRETGRAG